MIITIITNDEEQTMTQKLQPSEFCDISVEETEAIEVLSDNDFEKIRALENSWIVNTNF